MKDELPLKDESLPRSQSPIFCPIMNVVILICPLRIIGSFGAKVLVVNLEL